MRPRVTKQFRDLDGSFKERGSMSDLMTVTKRVFARNIALLGDDRANQTVLPGINAYNTGAYREALDVFVGAANETPELAYELQPHIRGCRRVMKAATDANDHVHKAKAAEWELLGRVQRLLSRFIGLKEPVLSLQCKYCGHYTQYFDPYVAAAPLGFNNCQRCWRAYPMPDYGWDSVDGQAYIYYRRSVREYAFYKEFESMYDVSPRWCFRGEKWTLEEVKVEGSARAGTDDWPFHPTSEDWGKRLGAEWARALSVDERKGAWERIVAGSPHISKFMPPQQVAERKWIIEDLKRVDDDVGFERMELDMGIHDGFFEVCEGLWDDEGRQ